MNDTNNYQSRWGYHPCDYNLFLKLKFLQRQYWQTLYDFHRWHRWWRKQEQNRVGREPDYCPIFVQDEPWYKRVRIHGEAGFKVYPKTVTDLDIVSLHQRARLPHVDPVDPFDEVTVRKIEELCGAVNDFLEN